jgi:hypothetical protein
MSAAKNYTQNPVYAARGARCRAESNWQAVVRDLSATSEQRVAAHKALKQAKADYRAALKQARIAATGSAA